MSILIKANLEFLTNKHISALKHKLNTKLTNNSELRMKCPLPLNTFRNIKNLREEIRDVLTF
jgi:hypothetical protein